jgi:hypothetical protein
MKYSFIKDLNGLEIVIMYISFRAEHTKCTTNTWEKNKGSVLECLIVPWKYLRQEKNSLSLISNRLSKKYM